MNVNMNQTNSSQLVMMMTPYLHFTGGDHLYFKSWHPSSHGAIAGASIALLILAILERFLHATRGAVDDRWNSRYGFYYNFYRLYFIVGSVLSP